VDFGTSAAGLAAQSPAAKQVKKDLRMAPAHIGVTLPLVRAVAKIAPAVDNVFGRASANAQLQPPAGDQVGRARVFCHIERVFVAHVDYRRANLDAACLGTNGCQKRERRSELTGEMMNPKKCAVRSQFLSRDGQVDGLQEHIGRRSGLRVRRRRPVPEREETNLLHLPGPIDGAAIPACRG
jgi:hypothetical protein